MKKILFVLFLLCFSITNTAFAVDMDRGINSFVEKVDKSDIVSASNIDFAVHVVLNKKHYTDKIHIEGLVTFVNYEHQEINRCRKKWVWRSSLNDPINYRFTRCTRKLLNA